MRVQTAATENRYNKLQCGTQSRAGRCIFIITSARKASKQLTTFNIIIFSFLIAYMREALHRYKAAAVARTLFSCVRVGTYIGILISNDKVHNITAGWPAVTVDVFISPRAGRVYSMKIDQKNMYMMYI